MDCFVIYHSSLWVNTVHPKVDWILHKISLVGSLMVMFCMRTVTLLALVTTLMDILSSLTCNQKMFVIVKVYNFQIFTKLAWYMALLVHSQVTIIFVVSVGLFVCLCRVFLSRLWSDFDQTRTYVTCLGLVVSPRIWGLCDPWGLGDP